MFNAIEIRESLLSSDPIAMCELLVGLGEVTVLDVAATGDRLRVTIETREMRPSCRRCEAPVVVKDRDTVELTDLPCFGQRGLRIKWTQHNDFAAAAATLSGSQARTEPPDEVHRSRTLGGAGVCVSDLVIGVGGRRR